MITYLGKAGIDSWLVVLAAGVTACSAQLTAQLPGIEADLAAGVQLQANMTITPPAIALELALAVELVTEITACITAVLPEVSFQLTAVSSLIASITLPTLILPLPVVGLLAYSYDGTGAAFGPAVTSTVAAGWPDGTAASETVTAFVIAATASASWTALAGIFSGAASASPGLVYTGSLTLAGLLPGYFDALQKGNAQLQVLLSQLTAKLNGALALKAALTVTPPSLVIALNLATRLVAKLTSGVGYLLPGVQLSLVANLLATIQLQIDAINLALSLLLPISSLQVLFYKYVGPAASFGGELAGTISSGWGDGTPASTSVNAMILATTSDASTAGLSTFFGGI